MRRWLTAEVLSHCLLRLINDQQLMALLEIVHRTLKLAPSAVELLENCMSVGREHIILSWWPLRAFLPLIGQETIIFESGEKRIECSFDDEQIGFLEFCYNIARIACLLT